MKAKAHAVKNNAAAIFAALPPEFQVYINNSFIDSTENSRDQSWCQHQ